MAELNNVLVNRLLVRSSIPLLYSIAKYKSNFKMLRTIKYTGITNIHECDIHFNEDGIQRAWVHGYSVHGDFRLSSQWKPEGQSKD